VRGGVSELWSWEVGKVWRIGLRDRQTFDGFGHGCWNVGLV